MAHFSCLSIKQIFFWQALFGAWGIVCLPLWKISSPPEEQCQDRWGLGCSVAVDEHRVAIQPGSPSAPLPLNSQAPSPLPGAQPHSATLLQAGQSWIISLLTHTHHSPKRINALKKPKTIKQTHPAHPKALFHHPALVQTIKFSIPAQELAPWALFPGL